MSHSGITKLFVIVWMIAVLGCENQGSTNGMASKPSQTGAKEVINDDFEAPPPRDTAPKVMQAKLAHSQAILEGLALADLAQIENNATALKRISRSGDWLAHESVEYFEFSTEFREICDDLVRHARAENMELLVGDYAALTNSCIGCHGYMRKQRATKDLPGQVSLGP